MQRYEGKLRSRSSLGKIRITVLRLFRMGSELSLSSNKPEESAHAVSNLGINDNPHGEVRNALLYSEMRKGQALLELQRHPSIR